MQRYQDVVLNSNGQPVASASVLVRPVGSTNTATIYSTNTGTASRSNPLTADSYGHFWFYGTNGRYDFVISGNYITTTTRSDIMLEDVPLSNLAELSTASDARSNLGLSSAALVSTATLLQRVNNLSDILDATAARGNLGVAIGTNVQAFSTGLAHTTQAQTWSMPQRGAVVALVSTGAIAPNFGTSNNFSLAMSVNNTLGSASGVVAGQSGVITITQDTAARTLTFNGFWKWANGSTATLSTATGATDVMTYYCYSTSAAVAVMHNNVS